MGSRRVPWSSTEEWIHVYNLSFNGDAESKKLASKRMAAWRARGTLPASVDATATLLDAICCDCPTMGAVASRDMQARCTHGIALMRFVNMITEFDQTGIYAQSVQRIASRLGIPEWIVDARHSVAHNDLPGLELLRGAAQFCLVWLKENYWELQLGQWTEAETKVANAVCQYSQKAHEVLKNHLVKKKSGVQISGVSELSKVVTESLLLCSESFAVHKLLASQLLKISEVLLDDGKQHGYEFPDLSSALCATSLPRAVCMPDCVLTACWPLLKWCQLAQASFFSTLLEEFGHCLGTCPPYYPDEREHWWRRQVLAASWILGILSQARKTKSSQQRLLKVKGLDGKHLLRFFLSEDRVGNPDGCGIFCADIISGLLTACPLEDEQSSPEATKPNSGNFGPLSTRICELSRAASRISQVHILHRFLSSDQGDDACCSSEGTIKWQSCPIGMLPDSNSSNLRLDLPSWFDDPVPICAPMASCDAPCHAQIATDNSTENSMDLAMEEEESL
eukprot:scpid57765/ scgid8966/ Ribosomal biogenesis protein LAS1L; Protein LAS1 homolog